jgi:hypothetical protein
MGRMLANAVAFALLNYALASTIALLVWLARSEEKS